MDLMSLILRKTIFPDKGLFFLQNADTKFCTRTETSNFNKQYYFNFFFFFAIVQTRSTVQSFLEKIFSFRGQTFEELKEISPDWVFQNHFYRRKVSLIHNIQSKLCSKEET